MKRYAWMLVCVLAVGCGSTSKEELSAEFIKSYCELLVRCGAANAQESCEQLLKGQTFGSLFFSSYEDSIASGKIKYDEGRAARCLGQIKDLKCDSALTDILVLGQDSGDCALVYEGTVKPNEVCSPGECQPDFYCSSELNQTCGGVCVPRVEEGQPATATLQCKRGLRAIDNECRKPLREGQSCGASGTTNCEAGLYCDPEVRVCRKFRKENEACTDKDVCGGFLDCVNGTCQRYGGAGTPCGPQANTYTCKLELFCDTTNATQTVPGACKDRLAQGVACQGGDCQGGLICSATCKTPVPDGQSCATDPCAPVSSYCDSSTRLCTPRKGFGTVCAQGSECQLGLSCHTPDGGTQASCTNRTCL